MSILRRVAANGALVIAGIAMAFIVAEFVLRLTPLGQPQFYTYDRFCGWTTKPGATGWQREEGDAWVSINREGFRGPEVSPDTPPGVLRIAVLGDSFTEASQVAYEDTFSAVMQRQLGACPLAPPDSGTADAAARRVEVLNFGCDSYGTAQELLTLEHRVWRFHPDFIVLAVFTGNDMRNNSVALEGDRCRPFYVVRNNHLVPGGPFNDSLWFRFLCYARFESRHSQVLNALGRARSTVRAWWRRKQPPPAAIARHARAAHHEAGINDFIYLPPSTDAERDAWRITEDEIEMVHQEAAAHHAGLLVVTLSNPIQDFPKPEVRARYMKALGIDTLFYPDARIAALGSRDGFAVLNLAPAMQSYADAQQVFLHGFPNTHPGVGHWNAAGHQVAGDLIAARICAMLSANGSPLSPSPAAPR
ncbi:MAG TPA: SGNH/GDSL hydrolase family protein [Candidatus Binataceae bacterium]|nr:SGNH/GDSL hydrolase family protein [Candidatus Binataceae bacterium]